LPGNPKSYTLDEAFAYCEALTKAHYENFPVASLFLPQEKRPYVQAIYAFSRTADDFADELELSREDRLKKLDDWEEKLNTCYEGVAEHPVFIALMETVKRLEIPPEPLHNLLKAFRQDVLQNRYETFEDLLEYCKCSANPVGRLVLMIFGYREEELFRLSDDICTGLQLANFWQDLSVDRWKNRLYIPLEDMRKFGYSPENWERALAGENFKGLLHFEISRTRALFYRGASLPGLLERDLQLELKLVWFGGMSILKSVEKNLSSLLSQRSTLKMRNKFLILMRGLFIDDLTRYGKKRESWDLT